MLNRLTTTVWRVVGLLAPYQAVWTAAGLGSLIFALSLFGIYSRPSGLLATFWVANAVLLGLFVHYPRLVRPVNWLAVMLGYMAADLFTGAPLALSLFLMACNLSGVVTGYAFFKSWPMSQRRLEQPQSVMYMVMVSLCAACAAGLVGMAGHGYFFHAPALKGFWYWSIAEWMNYTAILPVMLTLPGRAALQQWQAVFKRNMFKPSGYYPVLTLVTGILLGVFVGGPGALSFVVPGLIWCALTYGLFLTALLTLWASVWLLLTTANGYLDLGVNLTETSTLDSFRLGVTLTSLAPLTIASVMVTRKALIAQLQFNATHDALTHVLNRFGFYQAAELALRSGRSRVLLMLDIDHFKMINDLYGHAAGDAVLSQFAEVVRQGLHAQAIVGRLGGEEFCLIHPCQDVAEAKLLADRIRSQCASHAFKISDHHVLDVTVSIGMVYLGKQAGLTLDQLLAEADNALYDAKRDGRNRVMERQLG